MKSGEHRFKVAGFTALASFLSFSSPSIFMTGTLCHENRAYCSARQRAPAQMLHKRNWLASQNQLFILFFRHMISKEEVQHIAKLARLELTQQETEKMQKDMSAILDYFDILKRAPKVKSSSVVRTTELKENATRKDLVVARPASLANNLLGAAPDRKDDYFKVKSIL